MMATGQATALLWTVLDRDIGHPTEFDLFYSTSHGGLLEQAGHPIIVSSMMRMILSLFHLSILSLI
jgi:hypothetical protein